MRKNPIPFVDQDILEDVEEPLVAAVDLGSTSIVVYLLMPVRGGNYP